MVRSFSIFCVLLLGISTGYSQKSMEDSLSIEDGFWGMTYKQGDRELSLTEFRSLLKTNPDGSIYQRCASGMSLRIFADVFSFAGGFGLGYGLLSKPINTTSVVAGGIAVITALVLNSKGKSRMQEAVGQYNQQSHETRSNSSLYQFDHGNILLSLSFRL